MKRVFAVMFSVLLAVSLFYSAAIAGSTVAIVKYDGDWKTIGEGYEFDWTFLSHYDFDKDNKDALKFVRASWTPESATEIEGMVRKAIKLTGNDWPVKPGDTVLLKPNLVSDWWHFLTTGRTKKELVQAQVTDIRVVRGVAIVALESGASKVLFGESPAHGEAYASMVCYGYENVVNELNQKYGSGKTELLDITKMPYSYYKATKTGGLALKEYAITDIFVDPKVKVISISAMKTHCMAGVTLTMKNIGIGSPTVKEYGSPKLGLPHGRLGEVIVDVVGIVKPKYAVVSGIWGMEGFGPEAGNPVPMGMVIAGKDLVAVDYVTTEVMGFKGDKILSTVLGQQYGIGSYKDVNVVGRPIAEVRTVFEPVPRASRTPWAWAHNELEGYTPPIPEGWHY
jgi:uncharacterized protein (DUF362 family)